MLKTQMLKLGSSNLKHILLVLFDALWKLNEPFSSQFNAYNLLKKKQTCYELTNRSDIYLAARLYQEGLLKEVSLVSKLWPLKAESLDVVNDLLKHFHLIHAILVSPEFNFMQKLFSDDVNFLAKTLHFEFKHGQLARPKYIIAYKNLVLVYQVAKPNEETKVFALLPEPDLESILEDFKNRR